ncbi:MAG TPA: polysaccharide biosynthesis tyrosine autokinase [Anaerolineaceae bacterium]|nr:polysaccharide biosynthesis tyrosine autokinase [Anaerolineaceae bacterium]
MPSNTLNDNQQIGYDNKQQDVVQHYLLMLWHWIWLILLLGAVSAGSAYFSLHRQTPVYVTSTKVLVIAAPSIQTTSQYSSLTNQNLIPTYADLMTNNSILTEVIKRLGLSQTTDSLNGMINVTPVVNTSTIMISVAGTDRTQIANIANTLVSVFIDKINTLQSDRFTSTQQNLQNELASLSQLLQKAIADENAASDPVTKAQLDNKVIQYRSMYDSILTNYEQAHLAEIQATSSVVQIDLAGSSYQLIKPIIFTNTLEAGIVGLLLGICLVFVMDALDNTFKSVDEIARTLKLPVLGVIYKHNNTAGPITQTEPRSPTSDAFRSLRTNIQYADVDHPIRSILVTSATPGEGKSMVSVNLAVVLAQANHQVTLIDVDYHSPVIHKRMNLSNGSGLTTLLDRPEIVFDDILKPTSLSGLSIITTGEIIPPNPSEILASKKMAAMMDMLLVMGNIVVLDSPPILAVADAAILAPLVDGVLLVVEQGRTTRQAVIQAIENLQQVKSRIIGVVVNQVEMKQSSYGYYYEGYYKRQVSNHGGRNGKSSKADEIQKSRKQNKAPTSFSPKSKI